jgi:tetratricopeptide (TPR) repeat protein
VGRRTSAAPARTTTRPSSLSEGIAARERGDYPEAYRLLSDAVDEAVRDHGMEARELAGALNALGIVCKYTGRFTEGENHYVRALAILEMQGEGQMPLAAAVHHNIGGIRHARGDYEGAESPARRAVEINERALGHDHSVTAADRAALAPILDALGSHEEAEALLRRALATFEREHDDYEVAMTIGNLAAILQRRGDLEEAEEMHRSSLALKERTMGGDHPELATTLSNLATTLYALGRPDEAVPLLHRALALTETSVDPDHPRIEALRANLAKVEAV